MSDDPRECVWPYCSCAISLPSLSILPDAVCPRTTRHSDPMSGGAPEHDAFAQDARTNQPD